MNVNLKVSKMKGKALEKFQEYVYSKYEIGYYQFLELPLVCQQALWVEWFDSVGIFILIEFRVEEFWFTIKERKETLYSVCTQNDESKSRPEALSKAIEKAMEIFNNL